MTEIQEVMEQINELEHQVRLERIKKAAGAPLWGSPSAVEKRKIQEVTERINTLEHQVIILLDSINSKSLEDSCDGEISSIKEKIHSNSFGMWEIPLKNQHDGKEDVEKINERNLVQLKNEFGLTFTGNSFDNVTAKELIERALFYKGCSKEELLKAELNVEIKASTDEVQIFKSILRDKS